MAVANLPGYLSSLDIQEICAHAKGLHAYDGRIGNVSNDSALRVLSCNVKSASEEPLGFLGAHAFMTVVIETASQKTGGPVKETLKFFVKSTPNVEARVQYLEEFGVFKKEMFVFKFVLPKLEEVSEAFVPKCYYAADNLIIFENLIETGYEVTGRRDGFLDFAHLDCALKGLAKMHASSIVLENVLGISIPKEYELAVQENAYPAGKDTIRHTNFNNGVRALSELIKLIPKYRDSPQLNFILEEYPKQMAKIFQLIKTSKDYQNVFSHGDLWANNVMFKEEKGVLVDCKIIDFQLARYCPPMVDIMTILTIPTTRQFREEHLLTLLDNYYKYLGDNLAKHNLDIAKFIPKDTFERSIEEYRLVGLIESCLFSHMTILPTDLSQSLLTTANGFDAFFNERSAICLKAFRTDEIYRERLTDMISNLIDDYVIV